MDALDFLGGKYEKTEQIDYGPVETFRARNAATSKPVYIHRVSIAEEQPQQAALLRLLMTAMFRSSTVRKLVLDFGEEKGFWYVITESEPRCLLLKEWLQSEIDNVAPAPPVSAPVPAPPASVPPPALDLKTELQPNPAASHPPEPPAGEFTRVFRRSVAPPAAPSSAPPVSAAPAPGLPPPPTQAEAGEFTRFFKGGLPPSPPKSPSPASPLRGERPSNPDLQRRQINAQRPNTPFPPPMLPPTPPSAPPPANDSGEFTRMFSSQPAAAPQFARGAQRVPPPGLPDIFDTPLEAPAPSPSAKQQPGEYTLLFGKGEAPPPIQKPAAVAEPRSAPIVDDGARLFATRAPGAPPPRLPQPAIHPTLPSGPSEFTLMSSGPLKVNPPAMPSIPKPPAFPATPPGLAAVPVNNSKKLILFFAALGILALLLVAVMIFLTHKK
jgi:hypothetical protein